MNGDDHDLNRKAEEAANWLKGGAPLPEANPALNWAGGSSRAHSSFDHVDKLVRQRGVADVLVAIRSQAKWLKDVSRDPLAAVVWERNVRDFVAAMRAEQDVDWNPQQVADRAVEALKAAAAHRRKKRKANKKEKAKREKLEQAWSHAALMNQVSVEDLKALGATPTQATQALRSTRSRQLEEQQAAQQRARADAYNFRVREYQLNAQLLRPVVMFGVPTAAGFYAAYRAPNEDWAWVAGLGAAGATLLLLRWAWPSIAADPNLGVVAGTAVMAATLPPAVAKPVGQVAAYKIQAPPRQPPVNVNVWPSQPGNPEATWPPSSAQIHPGGRQA